MLREAKPLCTPLLQTLQHSLLTARHCPAAPGRETRNRESWVRAVPHMVPLCGTSGVAGLVFDEIVKDLDCTEMTSSTFESFVEALYKVEFAINVDEPWALIKEHSGIRLANNHHRDFHHCFGHLTCPPFFLPFYPIVALELTPRTRPRSEEKCILHTGYAADCSQFPPAGNTPCLPPTSIIVLSSSLRPLFTGGSSSPKSSPAAALS